MSDKNELFKGFAQKAQDTHATVRNQDKSPVAGVADEDLKKTTSCVSLTNADKKRLTAIAKKHGLTLSAFFLVAANDYVDSHGWE